MPVNGSSLPLLIQSQARSLARLELAMSYRCHVHRTICHHAQRPRRVAAPERCPVFHQSRRYAKTKSTVKLKDLPQGAVKLEPYTDVVEDGPRYPTVVQGHRDNMQKFKDCVILTRVGGFYELYFEQAEEFAPLLNLKLASKKTSAGPVPMAGFPFFQLDRFLKTLVQDLNKYVAISEEFAIKADEKARSGGLLFDRKVARVITPGTLIDEKFMDPSENNFLMAIYLDPSLIGTRAGNDESSYQHVLTSASQNVGLAWLDLSTGDFYTQLTTAQMLPSALARIGAREILVDQRLQDLVGQELQLLIGHEQRLMTFFQFPEEFAPVSDWASMLEAPLPAHSTGSFAQEEVAAGFSLLEYIRAQLQGLNLKLQPPRRRHLNESMSIDRNSLRGLEILETARDGFGKGSLLHAVRRTSTKSGARLLRDRLTSPSTSLSIINERLDLVSVFIEDRELRDFLVQLLKRSYDAQRLVQKFTLGRGDPDDLICLSRAIEASKEVKRLLSNKGRDIKDNVRISEASRQALQIMMDRLYLDGPTVLADKILSAIDEEGLLQKQRIEDDTAAEAALLAQQVTMSEGSPSELESLPRKIRTKSSDRTAAEESSAVDTWIMRRDASPALEDLHQTLEKLQDEKISLSQRLRDSVGSSALTLKWTPGLGHICHVKGAKISQEQLEALGVTRNVSSTKSTRSFYLPAWTELGNRMDQLKLQIRQEEQAIFESLRREVILNLVKIRRNASVMDELDVACSFATLAHEQNLTRPILTQSTAHKIVGGRHPTVKLGLEEQGRRFVSNDLFLGSPERIWLITGPNMAGKSTFLRQNALITILAQVGSFVPANYAEIGIVDQIFSRIGAADDLFRDQSTFMVEMLETAAILKQATPRSFVIMDEVGRGTTPEDGTAVSFACLHHLHYRNQCRTLFATHFHGLADMTESFPNLGRYCTDVRETESGAFSFVHRLRKGVNRESHALKVAQLAGLPKETLDLARSVRGRISGEAPPLRAAASCSD
ncbi:muts domain V-domain-containing protein [Aspergillus karnatakaensis]|uniref:mismatch repair ATPase MSH1 n=1 Tax=Aspergillus karnatakaensis TaxID=1810916 RepID=UPI003CCDE073